MNLWKKMKLYKKVNTLRKQLERTTDGTENGEGGTNITILNADSNASSYEEAFTAREYDGEEYEEEEFEAAELEKYDDDFLDKLRVVDGSMIDCLLDKMTGVFPDKSSRMLLYQTKSAVQTVHNCTGVMRALREEEIDSRLQAQTKRSLGGIVWSPYKGHFTPKMEITDKMLPVFDKVNRRLEEADVPARWRAVVRRRGNRIEVMELVLLCTEIRLLEHDVLETSVPPRDHFVINGFGFTPKMLPVFRETNDMFAAAGFPHFVSVSCVNFMDVNQDPECYAADNEWNEEADGEGEELDGEEECAGADSADIAYTLSSMKTELAIVSTALDMLLIRSSSEIMEKIIHIAKKAVETASDCVKEIEAAQLGEEN